MTRLALLLVAVAGLSACGKSDEYRESDKHMGSFIRTNTGNGYQYFKCIDGGLVCEVVAEPSMRVLSGAAHISLNGCKVTSTNPLAIEPGPGCTVKVDVAADMRAKADQLIAAANALELD